MKTANKISQQSFLYATLFIENTEKSINGIFSSNELKKLISNIIDIAQQP